MDASWLQKGWSLFERSLMPSACLVCQKNGIDGVGLCAHCRDCLPALPSYRLSDPAVICLGCGESGRSENLRNLTVDGAGRSWCGACAARAGLFRRIVAPWRYAYPLDAMILAMKRPRSHRGRWAAKRPVCRTLGTLLGDEALRVSAIDAVEPRLPDIVIPVPDHSTRRRQRGFNPAADVAGAAAHRLGLPCSPLSARRVVDTAPLANRSRAERALATCGAFRVDEGLYGQHIALVDDVLTSGATTRELGRECLDAGAVSVELWVLARTPVG